MASKKLLTRRNVIIVVVLIAVLLGAAYFGGLLSAGILGADTSTHVINYNGVYGGGMTGNRNPDSTPPGQLLDQDQYIASWDPSLIGQRATYALGVKVTGCGNSDFFNGCSSEVQARGARVIYSLALPNGVLLSSKIFSTQLDYQNVFFCSTVISGDCPANWHLASTSYWDILPDDGKTVIPDGSILTVTATVDVWWKSSSGNLIDKGYGTVATDQAVVQSGIGSVYFSGAHADGGGNIYYLTGETATVQYHVGYVNIESNCAPDCKLSPAWSVYVTSDATGGTVFGPIQLAQTDGSFSFPVLSSYYAPFKAQMTVYLNNNLWTKAYSKVSNVRPSDTQLMPTCYTDGWSPVSPQEGDTITYNFHCVPASSDPNASIDFIRVAWGYGTPTTSVDLPAGTTSYQFSATNSGIVTFTIVAYTVNGVPSGTGNYYISVAHQPANSCLGSDAYCSTSAPPGLFGIPIWVYFVVVAAVIILLAYFNPGDYMRPLVRIVLILIAVILIFTGLVFGGVLHF